MRVDGASSASLARASVPRVARASTARSTRHRARSHRARVVAMSTTVKSWDELRASHTASTSSCVKRLTEDAQARARGGGPAHQDNALRLFGAREEDVRVTFYRDHAGVRAEATRRRVGAPARRPSARFGFGDSRRTENERLTHERSHSRSGARTVKSFGSCSKKNKSRTE